MKKQFSDIFRQVRRIGERGSFVQNVSFVFGGNALNFVLQLLFSPIISRIFSPEAYGVYAYYNLIVSNVGFFSALSLPSVYVLPKTRVEYLALGRVVLLNNLLVTCLLILFFLFFDGVLFDYKGELLAIPIVASLILLSSINGIFSAWNDRSKKFGRNSLFNVISNLSAKGSVLSYGLFIHPSGFGLLVGDSLKSVLIFLTQAGVKYRLVILRWCFSMKNWKYTVLVLRRHLDVVKFIFPSQLINKFSADLPVLVIGSSFGTAFLGAYGFALTFLNIPLNLFENSIKPVIYQKANEVYQNKGTLGLASFFEQTFNRTFFGSLLASMIMSLLAPLVFQLVFGNQWDQAGIIASLMLPKIALQAVIAPYTGFWRIQKREKRLFSLNLTSLAFRSGPLLLVFLVPSEYDFIFLYSAISSIAPLINLIDLFFALFVKEKAFLLTIRSVGILLACFALLFFIK